MNVSGLCCATNMHSLGKRHFQLVLIIFSNGKRQDGVNPLRIVFFDSNKFHAFQIFG